MSDLISRQAALDAIKAFRPVDWVHKKDITEIVEGIPSAQTEQGWIPVKYHEITDEEREENGYPKDWAYHLDCEMPDDDQTIIVQTRSGWIATDICYIEDGYSLDSGWDWREDIVAWMKMPEPYVETVYYPQVDGITPSVI